MRLAPEPFEAICSGKKVIESRLFDEKRRNVALGDSILFSNTENPERTIQTQVTDLLRYSSFKELFENHDPALFGGSNPAELLQQIRKFYSEAEEEKYGVIGIRIEL